MKKYALMPICLILYLQVMAQKKSDVVKLDILRPIFSTFGASYEHFFDKSAWSAQAGGSYTYRKISIWENLEATFEGYSAELQVRHYIESATRDLPTGVFSGIFGQYATYQMMANIPAGKINFLDGNSKIAGVLLGYQRGFIDNRLFIEATIGGAYHFADYSGRFSERGRIIPKIITSGVIPKMDLKIGLGF